MNDDYVAKFTYGAFSSSAFVLSKTLMAPLERTQILLQCQRELVNTGRIPGQYSSGMFLTILKLVHEEGWTSLFRGNIISWAPAILSRPFTMVIKEMIHRQVRNDNDSVKRKIIKNTLCGGLGGVVSFGLLYHFEYVRTRLACDVKLPNSKYQFSNSRDVYRKTMSKEGIRGLHRGFFAAGLGFVAFRAIELGIFDSYYNTVLQTDHRLLITLSYLSNLTAAVVTYPFDTVRRRMMIRSMEPQKYSGTFHCFHFIIKHEGFLSLWRGGVTCFFKSATGGAILLLYNRLLFRYLG